MPCAFKYKAKIATTSWCCCSAHHRFGVVAGHYDACSRSSSLNDIPLSLTHIGLDEQELVDTQTRELNKKLKVSIFSF